MDAADRLSRAQLLMLISRPGLAEQEIRRQLSIEPENAEAHAMLAACLASEGRLDEAEDEARRSAALRPDDPYAFRVLAVVLCLAGELRKAQDAANGALCLAPDDADSFALQCTIEMLADRWPAALENAERGLHLEPENAVCLNARAMSLLMLGRREEAGASAGHLLAANPDDAQAHLMQGLHLLHKQEYDLALESLREALRLDPDSEIAKAAVVEGLKARLLLYRPFLRFGIWKSRLGWKGKLAMVAVPLGFLWLLSKAADRHPGLYRVFWTILGLLILFATLGILAEHLSILVLLTDPFGRTVVSRDQKRSSVLVGSCLLGAVAFAGGFAATSRLSVLFGALVCAAMVFQVDGLYDFKPGSMARIVFGSLCLPLALLGLGSCALGWLVSPMLALPFAGAFCLGWLILLLAGIVVRQMA